jgi:glyoxylase-like metal-dependent hydrolase (beta-lactamase superfamily II)
MTQNLFIVALSAGLAVLLLFMTPGQARAQATKPFQLEAGAGIKIWAVTDSIQDRDMGVFKGDQELIRRLAPTGLAPSAILGFLVKTAGQTILIDAGLGEEGGGRLLEGLEQIGLAPEEVDLVLLTHLHRDHVGGLIRGGQKSFPRARVKLSRPEREFWLDPAAKAKDPGRQATFDLAERALALYGSEVETFEFDQAVAPGLTALDASGHTPGHTAFLLTVGDQNLLFWGDLVHAAALQFPHPEFNASYDMNPEQAQATRVKFMSRAEKEKIPVAGAHLPFPGLGQVGNGAEGGYIFKPEK